MNKLLVLTPLPLEQKFLLERLKEKGHVPEQIMTGPLCVYDFKSLPLRISLGGHGKTQFGIQSQFLLSAFKDSTKGLICAGCAGGLDSTLKKGDVIVATKTIEHDYKIKFFKAELPVFLADNELLSKAKNIKEAEFNIHFQAMAGGDEDVLDHNRKEEIRRETKAMGIAWEGPGGARSAQFNRLPYLEIRGITDTLNGLDQEAFKDHLKFAMSNVADILTGLLINDTSI